MSLKKNILVNYVSQFYVTLIGIVMVPLYIKYMGAEAYGLVGFYAMLQAWFMLLDLGLAPTMGREVARFSGGATDALSLRRLLRSLEGIFIAVGLLGAGALMAGSNFIATRWLNVQHLPVEEVRQAILLMSAIVSLRWISGLYRAAINGFERLVWLSGFNIVIATARFVLVVPFLIFIGNIPSDFFTFQLIVSVVEVLVLVAQTYHLLPKVQTAQRLPWQWQPLRGVLRFSLSVAFASAVWVLVTQTDKLILSKILMLSDYAYFILAVLVASGVNVLGAPISGALLPRMTRLDSQGDEVGLIDLYRKATRLIGVIVMPTAVILAFFADKILWAWTGDADIALKAAPVLSLYALGNGMLALAAFPYYLQYAKGNMKLHLIGNVFFVMIFIPLVIWMTTSYGMVGAGYAWIIANLLPFIVWLPIVHKRFAKGLHTRWMLIDVLPTMLLPITVGFAMQSFIVWPTARFQVLYTLALMGVVLVALTAAGSHCIAKAILNKSAVSPD